MESNFSLDNNGIWRANVQDSIMYPDSGNKNSKEYEESGSFWFEHRNNIITEVTGNFPFKKNFADIGGGNGYQLLSLKKQYPDRKFYLIEPGYNGCLAAHERGIELVYNCTFQEFDFNAANIDGFGLFDVLEHIPDDENFLSSLYNSMPPGSHLYITLPAYQFLWNDVDDFGKHQRRYNKKMVLDLVQKTKFKVQYFTYFFSYLVWPTYFLRTIPYKVFGNRSDEDLLNAERTQHKPSKLQDSIFAYFNTSELNKVKATKAINSGASCFVVLQK
ncbi:MAG: Methyltransferase type 11 [Bacteroidota bacterium]|nr:Methyltransferase type 11 [Bacteroidota bacterium]